MYSRRLSRIGLNIFIVCALLAGMIVLSPPQLAQAEDAPPLAWIDQFGTTANDDAQAVAVDSTGVYVVGATYGALPGANSTGGQDVFLIKYNTNGNLTWIRQFGTSGTDYGYGIAVDSSGVYITGSVSGALPGESYVGNSDAFVRKYDTDGNVLWTDEFGTYGNDYPRVVAVDTSGVYVAGVITSYQALPGQTSAGGNDAFVRKYDADGNVTWTRQFGTSGNDDARAIAVDSSGVYAAGLTSGAFGGETNAGAEDAFIRKYDTEGSEVWTEQFGSVSADQIRGVAANSYGVYVAGWTQGALPGETWSGNYDAFVRKYEADGNVTWTDQFGTEYVDMALGISADSSAVYVIGETAGALSGSNLGNYDVFFRKYDTAGNVAWTDQFGTASADQVHGICVDSSAVYVAGNTEGAFPGETFIGAIDAFIAKYSLAVAENSAPTDISLSNSSVSENQAIGTAVGNFTTTDPDAGDTFTYSLVSGEGDTDNGNFTIDGDTLKTNAVFDYETQSSYSIRVRTTDSGSATFEEIFEITINDVVEGGVPTLDWIRQFGTTTSDFGQAVAADSSGIYVAGYTMGTLPGQSSSGSMDAFVTKYDTAGNVTWTRQFGTSGLDFCNGVSADSSGVYVVGHTNGAFPGESSRGNYDVFVRKYDSDGNVSWTDQFGASNVDLGLGVSVDSSGVYIAGMIGESSEPLPGEARLGGDDAFVRKYDTDGNVTWNREFGTSGHDQALGIWGDSSGVYVTGRTPGAFPDETNFGGDDAFVCKYDTDGNHIWTDQFGTSVNDEASGVSADSSGAYVSGYTGGALPDETNSGANDAFVRKYNSDGNVTWTDQFGSSANDQAMGIWVDSSGAYVAGITFGDLGGDSLGNEDAFVRKYDTNGNAASTDQFGSSGFEMSPRVSVDSWGIYISGTTDGVLPGQTNIGSTDAFIARYSLAAPENNAPTDISLDNTSVSENQPSGTTVGTFTSTDPNAGDTFAYSLVSGDSSTDNGSFTIDGDTLKTNAVFDYETKASYSIRVRTTDSGNLTYEEAFTITVTDVNENPTDISLSSTTVAENQAIGTTVGNFTTNDPDTGDTFTYSLVSGTGDTGNSAFSISGTNLLTDVVLDYEDNSSYSILVRSSDQGGLYFDKQFTITVTDVSENRAPADMSLSPRIIDENQGNGTTVGTFGTIDSDEGDAFTYSLVSGDGSTDNASFTIDGDTLKTNAVFDFETKASYSIRVRTTDSGDLFYEKAFTIIVRNVNENPTDITLSNSSVAEGQPSGTIVGSFTTTDPDFVATFAYSLVSGTGDTGNGNFSISYNNLVTAAVLDYEGNSSYSILVRSSDQGGLYLDKQFTITVTDTAENGAPTDITLSNSTIAENQPIGTTVGNFTTTDPDAGESFTYSLVSGDGSTDNASFTIDGDTLKTNAVFDFETKASYSIRVRTTDSGDLFYEEIFAISVTDVAETSAPVITTQPSDQTVTAGQTASFSAEASGYPAPTVQWQLSTNGGRKWRDISGADSSTYTTPPTTSSMDGYQYRAVFTNAAGSATTSPAMLTVTLGTADVGITKTGVYNPGNSTITWTIVVTNAGPDTAREVEVGDSLANGTKVSGVAQPSGATFKTRGRTVIVYVGDLAAGDSAVVVIEAQVTRAAFPVQNTATVTTISTDDNLANNSDTGSVTSP